MLIPIPVFILICSARVNRRDEGKVLSMLRKSAISLAIISALGAMQANALGLGEVKVSSALNQPLQAEIDLLQLRGLNASQVVTSLANTDDFYLAGVKPSPVLSDIRFKLDIKGGLGKIILTTSTPIREPFLNFLIEVNWPSGRLVREYTVLLDPPVFAAEDLLPRSRPVTPVAESAPSKKSAKKSASSQPAVSQPLPAPSKYRVTKSDTLWQIALATRPDSSISPQQMMLAIQRVNPDAFIKNNINRLRSGVVLDIPSKEQILSFTEQESMQEVKRQNRNWKDAPAAVASSKGAKLDAAKTSMKSGQAAVAEDAQLRIVSKSSEEMPASAVESGTVASETSATAAQVQPLVAEISAKNEELEEQLVVTLEGLNKVERDNVEMFDRLDRLSEQMASMQRLVELKDQQLAELQGQLAQKQASEPAPAAEDAVSISKLPFEWIAAAGAALLALLAGLLLFLRKRKQEKEVEEALDVLNQPDTDPELKESAAVAPVAGAVAVAAAEAVAEAAPADLDEAAGDDVFSEEGSDDPFNMSTESRGPVDEFDSISDDELDSALGDDLDMDLKLDEPVLDDPEMAEFSNSLLDDDEYDLSTGFEEDEDMPAAIDEDEPAAMEADDELGSDLDALLAENDFEDTELDLESIEAAEEAAKERVTAFEGISDDDFDGDLDALLAEHGLDESVSAESEAKESDAEEPAAADVAETQSADADLAAEFATGLDDDFSSDLDDLLAAEDEGAVTDALLAGAGSVDVLLDEEDSVDETLEQMLEDHDKSAESSGIDTIEPDVDEDDIPDDETLDALLSKVASTSTDAEDSSDVEAKAVDEGIDIDFDPLEDLDEDLSEGQDEAHSSVAGVEVDALSVDALPEQILEMDTTQDELAEFELDSEREVAAGNEDLDLDDLLGDDELSSNVESSEESNFASLTDDSFVFELDDAADDALDFSTDPAADENDLDALLQSVDSDDAGAENVKKSTLSLEDELDAADDAELEAELEQMLESEDNTLALQESEPDDEVNYLDEADEVGTKIDLARAYIDMEDSEGARDILLEVVDEGSPEQVSEAKQLLENLKS